MTTNQPTPTPPNSDMNSGDLIAPERADSVEWLRAKHSRHWEQEDADAADEIEQLRKDAELLAWVLEHPETAAECLEDAAAGDGTARSNLERRIAGLTQSSALYSADLQAERSHEATTPAAVGAPLQRQVRPCAWISEYGLRELTTDSEKLGSLEWEVKRNKERGYNVPLYTRTATGEHADRLRTALEDARRALHDIAEEWAGAECGEPVHAQEAYAIALARRMYGIAAAALRVEGGGA